MENTTDNQVTISVSEVECFLSQLNAQESLIQSLLEANRNLNLELEMLIQKAGLSENFQAPKEASNTSEIVSLKPVNIDPIPNVKKGDEQHETMIGTLPAVQQTGEEAALKKISNLPFTMPFNEEESYKAFDLSDYDSKAILKEFNDTDVPVNESRLIHKIFEEVVESQPERPAIVHNNQFLSYYELNQQANQMARYLRARGVFEGETIGIALPRSIDMVVAMLAVLKSGCTYIPIDPKETSKRLKFITFNADIQAVITLSENNKSFNALGKSSLKIINLDNEKGEISEMESGNLDILFSPTTPTHILYSSSPIKPVGIPFDTKTVLNELNWMWSNFPFSLREICCQVAPWTRAEFTTEIWAPLLKGITNILVPDEFIVDPKLFVEFLTDIHVSRIQLPASILAMMLNSFPDLGEKLPQLETWFLRGEILHSELIELFKAVVPGKKIVNLYNVTEAGGIAASFDMTVKTISSGILLGLPIDNMKVYLLDKDGRRVKPGEVGQIAISSLGTETGYLKNPILTKNRFAEDTLTKGLANPRKLYVTGDYGRLTADGYLEFLGRKDQLIKYYGNRIDLEDISRVLLKQAEVNEAVLTPEFNSFGQLVISSYLLVNDQTYTVLNWRKYLLKQMPEYMVPSKIYQLKASARKSRMPLRDDTMRLHQIKEKKSEASREENPPRDEIETTLISIWQQILNRQDVNIDDDFFEMGGNHIQTYRLKNRIQEHFDISIAADIVYRKPTISGIAVLLRESIRFKEKEESVSNADFVESFTQKMKVLSKEAVLDKNKVLEIQVGLPDRPKFFCVHGEDGDIAYLRYWIKYLGEQPFYSFQPRSIIEGKKEDAKSIEAIAADYIKEMQKLQPRGPYFLGGFSAGGVIAYEMAQQLTMLGEKIATLALIDTVNPAVNQSAPSLRNRFENLASAPAAYFNRSLFKKLTEQNFGTALYGEPDKANETLISPNFRKVIYEKGLQELIEKYRIKPYTGSILLISATDSAASKNYASIDRGWKGYALSLKIHEIQGDRVSLTKEPNARKVVQALLAYVNSITKKKSRKKKAQPA